VIEEKSKDSKTGPTNSVGRLVGGAAGHTLSKPLTGAGMRLKASWSRKWLEDGNTRTIPKNMAHRKVRRLFGRCRAYPVSDHSCGAQLGQAGEELTTPMLNGPGGPPCHEPDLGG